MERVGATTDKSALQPVGELPAIPPLEMKLMEGPEPLAITPVRVAPIEIPQLRIQPMEDRSDNNLPPKGGPRRIP